MRKARLLSASCHCHFPEDAPPEGKVAIKRQMVLECLDRAAAYGPDFVCFPEIILQSGVGDFGDILPLAEALPGETSALIAEKARALNSHVIFCTLERDGGHVYNTAALIGRDGGLVGRYRKYHATGYEIKDGVTPGEEIPVWETDCGRVGCAICFDLKFPAVGLALSRGRAQVVFWPSMFNGGRRLRAWAMDYGFYMVRCTAARGAVVDPTGDFIAAEGPELKLDSVDGVVRWTFAEVNTDRKTYHLDFHGEKVRAVVEKYGAGVEVHYMHDEGTFSLLSNLPGVTVEDLEKEFGLQDLRAYLDEAAEIREEALGRP